MDMQEKAIIRKQIQDMTLMKHDLLKDLKAVNAEIEKVQKFLDGKYKVSQKDKEILKQNLEMYSQNKKEIETTIKTAKDIINQLEVTTKPRSYLQTTRKLV